MLLHSTTQEKLHNKFSVLGAASDKVAALEKAGVTVTDSPAKIGAAMLKVTTLVVLWTR